MHVIRNKYLKFIKVTLPQEPDFQSKVPIKTRTAHSVCATGL